MNFQNHNQKQITARKCRKQVRAPLCFKHLSPAAAAVLHRTYEHYLTPKEEKKP